MDNFINRFNSEGYFYIVEQNIKKKIVKINNEINFFFKFIASKKNFIINCDDDLIKFRKKFPETYNRCFKNLYKIPELYNLINSKEIKIILKEIGFKKVFLSSLPFIRLDFPKPFKSVFKKHRDFDFNKESKKSVTFWIPLQDTNKNLGSLKIFTKEKIIRKNMKIGSLLVFNQMVLHESGKNLSKNKIRRSIQLRFFNYQDDFFLNNNLPNKYDFLFKKY